MTTARRGRPAPGPLPFTVLPQPGENVHGYVRRLAAANGHSNLATFSSAIGVVGIGPLSGDETWDRLRAAVDLGPDALEPMRWRAFRAAGGHRVRVLGNALAPGHVDARSARICPDCLVGDGLHRDIWSLQAVRACPLHGTVLLEACPVCGTTFSPAARRPTGCGCGARFADLAAPAAGAGVVRVARNVALLLGPATALGIPRPPWGLELPAALATVGLFDLLCLVELLGTAATVPTDLDVPTATRSRNYLRSGRRGHSTVGGALEAVAAADRIIVAWPHAFHELLEAVTARGLPGGMDEAFSTPVGRSLRYPPRGADGLPLRVVHESVDAFWRSRGGSARRRNLAVVDHVALRLHPDLSAAWLAEALGDGQATQFHGRVVQRVLEGLGSAERELADRELAALSRERALRLARDARVSLSPVEAKRRLEGTRDNQRLSGWDHPELLCPDPRLRDLRSRGVFYAEADVGRTLGTLAELAVRVEGPHGLVPLVSVGMRYRLEEPRPGKTEVLLGVFRRSLRVAAEVHAPTLGDLLVDVEELNGAARRARDEDCPDFLGGRQLNEVMLHRHGESARLSATQLARLAGEGLVRTETGLRHRGASSASATVTRFHVADAEGVIRRSLAGSSAPAEAAALAAETDVAPLLRAWHSAGMRPPAMVAELHRMGFRTVRGAAWRESSVWRAVQRLGSGPVLASSAADGLETP